LIKDRFFRNSKGWPAKFYLSHLYSNGHTHDTYATAPTARP